MREGLIGREQSGFIKLKFSASFLDRDMRLLALDGKVLFNGGGDLLVIDEVVDCLGGSAHVQSTACSFLRSVILLLLWRRAVSTLFPRQM